MSREEASALIWDVKRLRMATEAAGVALWSWNVDTDEIALDDKSHVLWGVPRQRTVTFEQLSANIHPADLDRVRSAFQATRAVLGPYEIDFRILSGDELRWVSARGQGDDLGIAGRVMFGVFLDVTERKLAEEAREMIAAEMAHRVKNLLAIAGALTTISARSADSADEMARDLTRRLIALGRAHDMVKPLSQTDGKPSALLDALLFALLEPYDTNAGDSRRVLMTMPEIRVGENAATAIALIIHELATNSLKYGALSVATGTLEISGKADEEAVVIIWEERNGPPIMSTPVPRGFGSTLVARSVTGQLGGTIDLDWSVEGLTATLRLRKSRLTG